MKFSIKDFFSKFNQIRSFHFLHRELSLIFRRYHDLAMQVLNECSSEDEQLTRKLLLLDCYNEGTKRKSLPSMTIAAQMESDEFIAHSTCQNLLDLEWEGALNIGKDGKVLVGKCTFHIELIFSYFINRCIDYPSNA